MVIEILVRRLFVTRYLKQLLFQGSCVYFLCCDQGILLETAVLFVPRCKTSSSTFSVGETLSGALFGHQHPQLLQQLSLWGERISQPPIMLATTPDNVLT